MAGFRIRADFDSLDKVGKTFSQQAEATNRSLQKINQQVSTLRGGDWVGKGAIQFYQDMDDLLLPSLNRLVKALEAGGTAMQKVGQIMHHTDEDQAALYRGEPQGGIMAALRGGLAAAEAAAAGGVGAAGGMSSAGAGAAGVAAGVSSAAAAAASRISNPSLAQNGGSVLDLANLRGLIGIEIQGASPELGQAMNSLSQTASGGDVTSILIEISGLRGRPMIEIQIEFDNFQGIQAQQEAAPSDASEAAAPEPEASAGGGGSGQGFQGSLTQMRFGKVVGDSLGVDPAFGAMLKPNGGLIGPGKFAIAGGNTPVGYHAVAHSAAGYLLNSHNLGPGYNYAGVGSSNSPQAGHLGGIGFWREATGGSSSVGGSSEWALGSVSGNVNMASSVIRGIKSAF